MSIHLEYMYIICFDNFLRQMVSLVIIFQSFEKAMRFSFEEFHIWHQFANALICAGKVKLTSGFFLLTLS